MRGGQRAEEREKSGAEDPGGKREGPQSDFTTRCILFFLSEPGRLVIVEFKTAD